MKLDELVELINLHKTDRDISIAVQYRENKEYFKIVDKFPEQNVVYNLTTDEIINIFKSVYEDAKVMYSNGLLLSYKIESEFSDSSEVTSYSFDVMEKTSYGGSGIFELRIFFVNKKSMTDKINKLNRPYQKLAHEYIDNIHPFLYTFKNALDYINGKFHNFFCDLYNQYIKDIKWQEINMQQFQEIILSEMKNNTLFSNILDDFNFSIGENKRQLVIKNKLTKFALKISQWTETNYCSDIEDESDEM